MIKTVILVCGLSTAASAAIADCSDDEISIREKTSALSGRTFEADMWVQAPMTRLYAVITDAEKHPEFVPDLDRVKIVRVDDDTSIQDQWLDLPLGKVKRYRIEVKTRLTETAARVAWKMVDWPGVPENERIADTRGYWELARESDDCTKATYHVYTDPGSIPFGLGWIVDAMTEDSVPAMLEAMRERALETDEIN